MSLSEQYMNHTLKKTLKTKEANDETRYQNDQTRHGNGL